MGGPPLLIPTSFAVGAEYTSSEGALQDAKASHALRHAHHLGALGRLQGLLSVQTLLRGLPDAPTILHSGTAHLHIHVAASAMSSSSQKQVEAAAATPASLQAPS